MHDPQAASARGEAARSAALDPDDGRSSALSAWRTGAHERRNGRMRPTWCQRPGSGGTRPTWSVQGQALEAGMAATRRRPAIRGPPGSAPNEPRRRRPPNPGATRRDYLHRKHACASPGLRASDKLPRSSAVATRWPPSGRPAFASDHVTAGAGCTGWPPGLYPWWSTTEPCRTAPCIGLQPKHPRRRDEDDFESRSACRPAALSAYNKRYRPKIQSR